MQSDVLSDGGLFCVIQHCRDIWILDILQAIPPIPTLSRQHFACRLRGICDLNFIGVNRSDHMRFSGNSDNPASSELSADEYDMT